MHRSQATFSVAVIFIVGWVLAICLPSMAHGQSAGTPHIDIDTTVEAGEVPPGFPLDIPAPVTVRYIHGTFGDANFTIFLPKTGWNENTVLWLPGGYRAEFPLSLVELELGYARLQTDSGFEQNSIGLQSPDQVYEAISRALQLTTFAESKIREEYGRASRHMYAAGLSAGAHTVKVLAERHPTTYDAAISIDTLNSWYEISRQLHFAFENCDVDQLENVNPKVFEFQAELRNRKQYTLGLSQAHWASIFKPIHCLFSTQLLRFIIRDADPTYDPDGDGVLSRSEIIDWDPERQPFIENTLRRSDVTGRPMVPIILLTGGLSVFSQSQQEYHRLASEAGAQVKLYVDPSAFHFTVFSPLFYIEALQSLDGWVEGGIEPGNLGGLSPE